MKTNMNHANKRIAVGRKMYNTVLYVTQSCIIKSYQNCTINMVQWILHQKILCKR